MDPATLFDVAEHDIYALLSDHDAGFDTRAGTGTADAVSSVLSLSTYCIVVRPDVHVSEEEHSRPSTVLRGRAHACGAKHNLCQ